MSKITEETRAKAELTYGDEPCRERAKDLLKEVGLPTGLLPLKDIIECGYVKETGFVWLKQKNQMLHKWEKLGKIGIYEAEITGYVDKNKIKKMTGLKVKELLIWITVSEVSVEDPNSGRITFKIPAGLYRTFPATAFESDETQNGMVVNKK
ncbi:hypothetical protein ACHQM5_001333 [Ranunculus cassubicifolius]